MFDDEPSCSCRSSSPWTITAAATAAAAARGGGHSTRKRQLQCSSDPHHASDANADDTGVPSLIRRLEALNIGFKDLNTRQSSLEDIFVSLVHQNGAAA